MPFSDDLSHDMHAAGDLIRLPAHSHASAAAVCSAFKALRSNQSLDPAPCRGTKSSQYSSTSSPPPATVATAVRRKFDRILTGIAAFVLELLALSFLSPPDQRHDRLLHQSTCKQRIVIHVSIELVSELRAELMQEAHQR